MMRKFLQVLENNDQLITLKLIVSNQMGLTAASRRSKDISIRIKIVTLLL